MADSPVAAPHEMLARYAAPHIHFAVAPVASTRRQTVGGLHRHERLQNPEQPPAGLATMLARVLSDPVFRDNAQAFARKYANFDQAAVLGHIVRRIEEIVNVHPPEDKGTP